MTKTNAETIKKDEIKVLNILEHHAKENIGEIAKECGFSPQKVARIIKNLEKNKKIWGYSAITGPNEKELQHFIVLMKKSVIPFNDTLRKEIVFEKLDDKVKESVKIENIYLVHGNYDMIFTFYAPNLVAAKNFVNCCCSRYNKYIGEILLLEGLFPIRKQGIKNPNIEKLVEYL